MVLPELLSGTAFIEYAKASNQTPAAIYSYCSAVQWFLSTFASEEALSDAVLSLANLRQSLNLSVEGFANLIQRDASKLCGLVPEREQKRIFRKGLLPSCRRMVEALARHDDVPWATLVRVALAGETSVPSNTSRLSGGRSAAVTQADVQRVESVNMTRWRQPVQEQLAAMRGTGGGALPTTHGGHEELTFTDRVASLDDDEADMHAFLAEYDGRGRDRARSVCFLCYKPGHYVGECPWVPAHEREAYEKRRAEFLRSLSRRRGERSSDAYRRDPSRIPASLRVSDSEGGSPSSLPSKN
jgi:hypothetical protein